MLQGSLESLCDEHDPSRQSTLHVLQVRIALHRIALHRIASHCIALHRIALHWPNRLRLVVASRCPSVSAD
jgi:hypothetical protein